MGRRRGAARLGNRGERDQLLARGGIARVFEEEEVIQIFRRLIIQSGRLTAPSLYLYGSSPLSKSKTLAPDSIACWMIWAVRTTPVDHSRLALSKPQL